MARRPRSSPAPPSEAELALAWEARGYASTALIDSAGRRLQVVFPGRRWGGPGPDFRGAVLALADGRLVRGDVEVHRRASGWAAHRHAADPAYAGVVLHVVGLADRPTLDGMGRPIATLVLPWTERWPAEAPDHGRAGAARVASSNGAARDAAEAAGPRRDRAWLDWQQALDSPCQPSGSALRATVEAAGRTRFRARMARFEGDLAAVDADQVVWRGVAEALGFSRNTASFGRLADAVPWAEAAQAVAARGPLGLAGLLLGTAGLLREASLAEAHAFRAFERSRGARALLSAAAWDRRARRAANDPAVRCRGLAELASRWSEPAYWPLTRGPAAHVLAAVERAAHQPRPSLWRLVAASPWIGRGRAQVVVVNVLLPFAAAAGLEAAAELFERLPGEPDNRVIRYMAAQLSAATASPVEPTERLRLRGALHQQGLLHLFKTTCASRLCGACPARGQGWPWLEDDDDPQPAWRFRENPT